MGQIVRHAVVPTRTDRRRCTAARGVSAKIAERRQIGCQCLEETIAAKDRSFVTEIMIDLYVKSIAVLHKRAGRFVVARQ